MFGSDSPTNVSLIPPVAEELHVVAAVIQHDGLILAAKRLPGGSASEKWEFPGGKVEVGETHEAALIREIREELDIEISVESKLGTFVTDTERYRIHLHCYICGLISGSPELHAHSKIQWCNSNDLLQLDWATADIPALSAIVSLSRHQP